MLIFFYLGAESRLVGKKEKLGAKKKRGLKSHFPTLFPT
jgi:hypothetical protein